MDQYIPPALGRYSKAISGLTTAYVSDAGITFNCNGTFTLTLDLPANLGANWMCAVMNVGAGVITINAQAANIISSKGLTDHTDILTSGRAHIIGCDGTSFTIVATNYDEVGSAVWGNITGTLSAQTDLQNAMDLKVDETVGVTGAGMLDGGGVLTTSQTITLKATAANTILGNNTGSPAVPIAMTIAQTKTLLAYTPADIAALPSTVSVNTQATSVALNATNTGKGYINTGAAGLATYTLPAAPAVGTLFFGIVDNVNGIKFLANTGQTVTVGTTVSSSAGYTTATAIGSTITLVYAVANKWVATSITGTWTTA